MGQKGQALLEIVIALIVMAVAIVGLLYGVTNSILAVNRITEERTAMNLARSQMEYLKAKPFVAGNLQCEVTEAMSGGPTEVTLTYINQDGQTGRTTTFTIPADAPQGWVAPVGLQGADSGVLEVTDCTIATTGGDVTDGAFTIRGQDLEDASKETVLGYFQVTEANAGHFTDVYKIGLFQYACRVTETLTGGPTLVAVSYINQDGRTNSLSGTLTFTPGSSIVTGTDSLFTTELRSGDYIMLEADGLPVEVESVESDASLTLTTDYPGAGGSGPGRRVAVALIPENAKNGTVVDLTLAAQDTRILQVTDITITGGASGGKFVIEDAWTNSILGTFEITGPDEGNFSDVYLPGHYDYLIDLEFSKQSDYLQLVRVTVHYGDRSVVLEGYKSKT